MALTQREAFARLMEHMCEHDGSAGHGYSQPNREGVGTELVDLGDGVKVYIKGGDRDCSSAICSCLKAVGIDVHGASYTGNMLNIAKNSLFKAYKRPTSYSARRGDIYLNTGKHAAMCTYGAHEAGGDMLCQFSISEKGTINGATGDQTGKESNFKAFYDYPWTHTIAWTGDGATLSGTVDNIGADAGGAVAVSGKLDVDGWWGKNTTRELQRVMGTVQDGIISNQHSVSKKYHQRCDTKSWKYGDGGSDCIKALQGKLGVAQDRYCGPATIKALQKHLGVDQDGYCGVNTVTALQQRLNNGTF